MKFGFMTHFVHGWWSSEIFTASSGAPFSATDIGFPFTVVPPSAAGKSVNMMDYYMKQSHMLQYNLTLERQLPASLMVSLAYAGSRGLNLVGVKDANAPYRTILPNGGSFWTGNEPLLNPNWAQLSIVTAGSDSWYNFASAIWSLGRGPFRTIRF